MTHSVEKNICKALNIKRLEDPSFVFDAVKAEDRFWWIKEAQQFNGAKIRTNLNSVDAGQANIARGGG